MSHFTSVKTQFKNAQCLIDSLQELGFPCEVHDTPQHLYGWQGDRRAETAQIIVRRIDIGGLSNDLGFVLKGDLYQAIISQYDAANGRAQQGLGLGPSFLPSLRREYARLLVERRSKRMGYRVTTQVTREGGYKLILTPTKSRIGARR